MYVLHVPVNLMLYFLPSTTIPVFFIFPFCSLRAEMSFESCSLEKNKNRLRTLPFIDIQNEALKFSAVIMAQGLSLSVLYFHFHWLFASVNIS